MRKFTLLFMSMFLVLGTAMAQDAEELKLTSVTPQEGAYVTSRVDYIQFIFNKEVSVTLPEGGIAVVNATTNKEIKLTRVNEFAPKNYVVLMFEQVVQTDKNGEEETIDQYIDAPGTYTYIIPSGIIKSVDDEEFAGGTYSFTIPSSTFEIKGWSPGEATELNNIVISFDTEISDVKLPTSGLEFLYNYRTPITVQVAEKKLSDDKKSVTLVLETPLTNPGSYDITLAAGTFISGDAISEKKDIWFTIIDPAPIFFTNYNNGDKVKELVPLEITFKNVETVELLKSDAISVYLPGESTSIGNATLTDKKITVTFDTEFTENGNYTFYIPAGTFTMDGEENEEYEVTVELFSFTVVPLEVVSVTPEVGKVDQIEKITIKFNQPVSLYYDKEGRTPSSQIVLKCGENEYVLLNEYSNDLTTLVYTTDEWTGTEWASKPITAEGVYTLDLSSIIVNYGVEDIIDEWGYPDKKWHEQNYSLEGTYTWTVSGNNASVDNIPVAEGEQVIYDLLGRRVENITGAGIYIVNGKKVVIK